MTDIDYRALLDWFMCSDPWPISNNEHHETIESMLDKLAHDRAFDTWVHAYHGFKASE